jgi:hypothetical protein
MQRKTPEGVKMLTVAFKRYKNQNGWPNMQRCRPAPVRLAALLEALQQSLAMAI